MGLKQTRKRTTCGKRSFRPSARAAPQAQAGNPSCPSALRGLYFPSFLYYTFTLTYHGGDRTWQKSSDRRFPICRGRTSPPEKRSLSGVIQAIRLSAATATSVPTVYSIRRSFPLTAVLRAFSAATAVPSAWIYLPDAARTAFIGTSTTSRFSLPVRTAKLRSTNTATTPASPPWRASITSPGATAITAPPSAQPGRRISRPSISWKTPFCPSTATAFFSPGRSAACT